MEEKPQTTAQAKEEEGKKVSILELLIDALKEKEEEKKPKLVEAVG
jgi:hypothetical protein